MIKRDNNAFRIKSFEKLCKKKSIDFFYADNNNRDVALIVSGGDHYSLLENYSQELYEIVSSQTKLFDKKYQMLLNCSNLIASGKRPKIKFVFKNQIIGSNIESARDKLIQELSWLNSYRCDDILLKISRSNKTKFSKVYLDMLVHERTNRADLVIHAPNNDLLKNIHSINESQIIELSNSIFCGLDYDFSNITQAHLPRELVFFLLLKIDEQLEKNNFVFSSSI